MKKRIPGREKGTPGLSGVPVPAAGFFFSAAEHPRRVLLPR